jgi:hypothetical protein
MTIMGATEIPLLRVKGEKRILDQGYLGKPGILCMS